MSRFKINGVVYAYTTIASDQVSVETVRKYGTDLNKFTMFGDQIFSYNGKIYCIEDSETVWNTEVVE